MLLEIDSKGGGNFYKLVRIFFINNKLTYAFYLSKL